MAQLAKKYTPEQLKAIEAGEEAIDAAHLAGQGRIRQGYFRPRYLDDFASVHPVIDKPIRNPESNYDPRSRYKTEDEIMEDYARLYKSLPDDLPEDEARLALRKFEDENRFTVGSEAAERAPRSYLADELPPMKDPTNPLPTVEQMERDPLMHRVHQETGFTHEEVRKFRIKTLVEHTVTNQTRMGKLQSFYVLTVAGDGKGLLGIGEGKAIEPEAAANQARRAAVRGMQPIMRYEKRTIYGHVEAKVAASIVKLMARPPGMYIEFPYHCSSYAY